MFDFKFKLSLNFRAIVKITGGIAMVFSLAMLPSLVVAVYYGEYICTKVFISTIIITGLTGFFIRKVIPSSKKALRLRESFMVVAMFWLIASVIGMMPYIFSGAIPDIFSAFFETVSGLTTTGSTILTDVEKLPKSILFWRSFTHWIGGMGILIFAIALLPTLGLSGQNIAKAESPGPTLSKISPKMSDTARILYGIYGCLTLIELILLKLGGLSWFDSMIHTFGTVGTGGFSCYNDSIAHFNSLYVEIVIGVFMILAGINFNLYYFLVKRKWENIKGNTELKVYLGIIISFIAILTCYLTIMGTVSGLKEGLRVSFFQVAALITTTGYCTADFNIWPTFATILLFALIFSGGCSSSTSGGIKIVRISIWFKMIKQGFANRLHPRAVVPVKLEGRNVPAETLSGITSFLLLYLATFVIGTVIISLENFDMVTCISSVATCLGNVGPGFSKVGPVMNFSIFSNFSKFVLSILMLIGRLELFTIILLFTPAYWRKNR